MTKKPEFLSPIDAFLGAKTDTDRQRAGAAIDRGLQGRPCTKAQSTRRLKEIQAFIRGSRSKPDKRELEEWDQALQDWLALHAEVARLRAVIAQVEWIRTGTAPPYCPWCHCTDIDGHVDCPRQQALTEGQP